MTTVTSNTQRLAARAFATTALATLMVSGAVAAETANAPAPAAETPAAVANPPGLKDGRIGYVLTTFHWTVHATEQKTECPNGFNLGPREQYAAQFPKEEGKTRRVIDTELKREAAVWFPSLEPDEFEFKEAVSKVAPGVNLDGKVGDTDFTSPDGEAGIDNQFYRMLGCIEDYRPGGSLYHFNNLYMKKAYSRILVELSNVDDLTNDDDVTVTVDRGIDPLLTDATGNSQLPYGTQRVDARWGKRFHSQFRGKIVGGVLITAPADINLPYNYAFNDHGLITMRGSVLKVNLTGEQANGFWGGFIDYKSFYRALNGALGTHSLSYGKQAAPSMYRAMAKLADGYPDPKTGRNTAISGAITVNFRQAYIERPDAQVASEAPAREDSAPSQSSVQRAFR